MYTSAPWDWTESVWIIRQNDNSIGGIGGSKSAYCIEDYLFDCRVFYYADLSDTNLELPLSMADNNKFESISVSFSECSTDSRAPIPTDGPQCFRLDEADDFYDGTYTKTGEVMNGEAVYQNGNYRYIFRSQDGQWVWINNVYNDIDENGKILCSRANILECGTVTECPTTTTTTSTKAVVAEPDCVRISDIGFPFDAIYAKTSEIQNEK